MEVGHTVAFVAPYLMKIRRIPASLWAVHLFLFFSRHTTMSPAPYIKDVRCNRIFTPPNPTISFSPIDTLPLTPSDSPALCIHSNPPPHLFDLN